jgi:hypothetical protein
VWLRWSLDYRNPMKARRLAILAVLAGAMCLGGLAVLLLSRRQTAPEVSISLRGFQTNAAGTLCASVVVTNTSTRPYGIAFATQSKSGGWTHPSLIPLAAFYAGNGDIRVNPRSQREFLVPLRGVGSPWRLAAAYFEQVPPRTVRYWLLCAVRGTWPGYRKFLTSQEVSSNPAASGNGAVTSPFHAGLLGRPVPEPRCSAKAANRYA